ncbi:uncharacterized protein LOC144099398 isoform X4 [Amblyomma americanum]
MPSTAAPFRPEQKGMRFVGMEWAPLQLPLHRRLETLAAVYFTFSFLAQGIVGWLLLLYVLLCTRLYPLSLLYAAWLYWDRNTCDRGGRRSDWARRWTIWKYVFGDARKPRLDPEQRAMRQRGRARGGRSHRGAGSPPRTPQAVPQSAQGLCPHSAQARDSAGPRVLFRRERAVRPVGQRGRVATAAPPNVVDPQVWLLAAAVHWPGHLPVQLGLAAPPTAGRHRSGKTARRPQERESQRRGGRPRAPAVRRRTGAALQRAQEPLRGAGSRAHHHLKPGKTAQRVRRVSAPRCLHSRTKDDDSGGVLDYPRPDIPRKWCTGHGSD